MAEVKKLHVKKEDKVVILAGKDKGKEGKVKAAEPKRGRLLIEGVNMVSRHTKPSQSNPQGGIIRKEAPVDASNVMLVCPSCKKPTRIAKKQWQIINLFVLAKNAARSLIRSKKR